MAIISWILLIGAALDLRFGFPDLPAILPFLIAPVPLALSLLVATGRIGCRSRPAVAAVLAVAGLAWILAGSERGPAPRSEAERQRLEWTRERRLLESAWSRYRDRLAAVATRFRESAPTPSRIEAEGFDLLASWLADAGLPADRTGFALYVEEDLLAWAGSSSAPALDPGFPRFGEADSWIEVDRTGARLMYRIPAAEGPVALLIESILQLPSEPDPARAVLEYLSLPSHLGMRLSWRGNGEADPGTSLHLELPAGPDRIRFDRTGPAARSGWRRPILPGNLGSVLLALLFFGHFARRLWLRSGPDRRLTDLGVASGWLWATRAALTGWVWPEAAFAGALFGPQGYASTSVGPLLRSPAGLFLTAAALLVQAFLLLEYRAGAPAGRPGSRSRLLPRTAAAAGTLLAGIGTIRFAAQLPDHTDWDLLRLHLLHLEAGPLVLVLSLGLLSLAAVVFTAAIWIPGLRGGSNRWETLRRHPLPALLVASLLMDLLVFPALAAGYHRVRQQFVEEHLRPRILEQEDRRLGTLRHAAAQISRSPLACRALAAGDTGQLAFAAWLDSDLARSGYDSSLVLFDAAGDEVSRFAVNLPPGGGALPVTVRPAGGGRTEVERFGSTHQEFLRRETPIRCGDDQAGTAVLHVLNEPENLPYLAATRLFSSTLWTGTGERLPGFLRGILVHRLNDRSGLLLLQTREGLPPPTRAAQNLFASDSITALWETVRTKEETYELLSFPRGNLLWSVGYRAQGPLRIGSAFIRFLIVDLALAGVILLSWWSAAHRWSLGAAPLRFRLERGWGGSFFRKLFLIFLAGSLLPLLSLSVFLNRVVDRHVESGIRSRAVAALGAARRVVGDYLAEAPAGETINDDDLFWLSQVVGGPLSLFDRGELVAASHPALYDTGFLPPRLPGGTFREIFREALTFSLVPQRVGASEFLVGSASLAREGQPTLVVSVFLPPSRPDVDDRERQLTDAALVASAGLFAIVGLLGLAVAGRIARPIDRLSRAAGRIRSGDLDQRIDWTARDEIGDLVGSFNEMATSLRRQRRDLQERSEYIEAILAHATTGVVSLSASGILATANPAARQLLGLGADLEPGCDLPGLLAARPALQPLGEFLRPGSAEEIAEREFILPGGDGEPRHLRAVRVPLPAAGGSSAGHVLLLEDVTETVVSSRLGAWAEMARGIAHEIKNPLTPIVLSAEHIRRVWRDHDPGFDRVLEECLETIGAQTEELRRIAHEFSDYSRIPDLQREPTPVGPFLEKTAAPYRRAAPPGIEFRLELEPDLPEIDLDRRVIRRALVNLIENGLQAMPSGGKLELRARQEGSELRIAVIDDGEGIPAERLERLFEPYFSTREAGTGLGLALARSAVEQHDGRIEVRSRPGEGTRFTLVLPVGRSSR